MFCGANLLALSCREANKELPGLQRQLRKWCDWLLLVYRLLSS